eukprot:snap_masked-scaffold_40-processed-gene-0.21-mRNA-1 protein AED:0.01 eAED:0.01 QI:0/-1/0/1/-1/1/1/0/222
MKKIERLSRQLSKILRHSAISEGLTIGNDGFVSIPDLLSLSKLKNHTFNDLIQVTLENNKNRYAVQKGEVILSREELETLLKQNNPSAEEFYIRANQGHSIKSINPELLLTPIISANQITACIHGTYEDKWNLIKKTGLSRMNRNNIHFSEHLPGNSVRQTTGIRKSATVYIYINLQKAFEDGILFYKSANGVILSSGIDGYLPTKYFLQVIQKSTGNKLEF